MAALLQGRRQLGQSAAFPYGATCVLESTGAVAVLDPASRQRVDVMPATSPAAAETALAEVAKTEVARAEVAKTEVAKTATALAEVATAGVATAERAGAEARQELRPETVPEEEAVSAPGDDELLVEVALAETPDDEEQPAQSAETSRAAPATLALQTPASPHAEPPPPEVPEQAGGGRVPAPDAAAQPPPDEAELFDIEIALPVETSPAAPAQPLEGPQPGRVATEGFDVILSREEQPTKENPLTYRERSYYVADEIDLVAAEEFLQGQLRRLQGELEAAPRGKFINLAAFDHRWSQRPERPPIIMLQWKDWHGQARLSFPGPRRRKTPLAQPGQDERLAEAFEALQELAFIATPRDALQFVVKMLRKTIPAIATTASLYDINTDELRVVVAEGPEAEQLQGRTIPLGAGIAGASARVGGKPSTVLSPAEDSRYREELDGRPGLEVRSMLLCPVVHEGHLLGMLQLLNRLDAERFSKDDLHLINYVASRLAEFLHHARIRAGAQI
ncbi:MAG: GAF domain-containing protein [Proteobacteria bacterium]|nr:GAF domain-containing protein [Pseudomonadota bacterium]